MASYTIPLRSDNYPSQEVSVTLTGSIYKIAVRWNDRDGYWYLSLLDADSEPILAGVRIVSNWDFLRKCSDARRPNGTLMVINTEDNQDPGRYDLGTKIKLVFTEAES